MIQVDIHEAESIFDELVEMLETGREDCIVIARNGLPAVKMIPYDEPE